MNREQHGRERGAACLRDVAQLAGLLLREVHGNDAVRIGATRGEVARQLDAQCHALELVRPVALRTPEGRRMRDSMLPRAIVEPVQRAMFERFTFVVRRAFFEQERELAAESVPRIIS
ncbi:hypothetical protein PQR51_07790 [Caballeronia grimmiae]